MLWNFVTIVICIGLFAVGIKTIIFLFSMLVGLIALIIAMLFGKK